MFQNFTDNRSDIWVYNSCIHSMIPEGIDLISLLAISSRHFEGSPSGLVGLEGSRSFKIVVAPALSSSIGGYKERMNHTYLVNFLCHCVRKQHKSNHLYN